MDTFEAANNGYQLAMIQKLLEDLKETNAESVELVIDGYDIKLRYGNGS